MAERAISVRNWPSSSRDGLLLDILRCIDCGARLGRQARGYLPCLGCGRAYSMAGGTFRALRDDDSGSAEHAVKQQTAEGFAYEWEHFGQIREEEWARNFREYLRPLDESWFKDKVVLDVGTGSGRHSRRAAQLGAKVVAVDLGDSIDVARRNVPDGVMTVQADAENLPFAHDSFDLVMSIGVLHHLPDPERALRSMVPYVKPGGWLQVYLYWWPETAWHRTVLRGVAEARRVTVPLPHRLLHALCYPLAVALFAGVVLPHRHLRWRPRSRRLAGGLPLKTYADYPFSVLVNDQFDRLSAPIEHRYTASQVESLLRAAGLIDSRVAANNGWVGNGRRPDSSHPPASE